MNTNYMNAALQRYFQLTCSSCTAGSRPWEPTTERPAPHAPWHRGEGDGEQDVVLLLGDDLHDPPPLSKMAQTWGAADLLPDPDQRDHVHGRARPAALHRPTQAGRWCRGDHKAKKQSGLCESRQTRGLSWGYKSDCEHRVQLCRPGVLSWRDRPGNMIINSL